MKNATRRLDGEILRQISLSVRGTFPEATARPEPHDWQLENKILTDLERSLKDLSFNELVNVFRALASEPAKYSEDDVLRAAYPMTEDQYRKREYGESSRMFYNIKNAMKAMRRLSLLSRESFSAPHKLTPQGVDLLRAIERMDFSDMTGNFLADFKVDEAFGRKELPYEIPTHIEPSVLSSVEFSKRTDSGGIVSKMQYFNNDLWFRIDMSDVARRLRFEGDVSSMAQYLVNEYDSFDPPHWNYTPSKDRSRPLQVYFSLESHVYNWQLAGAKDTMAMGLARQARGNEIIGGSWAKISSGVVIACPTNLLIIIKNGDRNYYADADFLRKVSIDLRKELRRDLT